jgi:hypothetical protein
MFVKPGPRPDDPSRPLVVRKPNRQFMSPLGEEVPETNFWHRRLRDGDVVEAEPIKEGAELEEAKERVRELEAAGEHPATEGPTP